jgi:hypothetical protein
MTWKIVLTVALVGSIGAVSLVAPDIRRYLRIRSM